MFQRKRGGFTLVELLVVVAIIGILAAIAIPNLMAALKRSRQRRTMADMRTIATAWEARATDLARYNAAGGVAGASTPLDVDDLALMLAPTYIKALPKEDGWRKEFQCYTDEGVGSTTAAQAYAIISGGNDEKVSTELALGPFTNYDCDIVYANGTFLSFPTGYGGASQ